MKGLFSRFCALASPRTIATSVQRSTEVAAAATTSTGLFGCPFAESNAAVRITSATTSIAATPITRNAPSTNESPPKPFSQIPGPMKLPLLGAVWELLLPKNKKRPLHMVMMDRVRRYGKVYRDKIPGLPETVMIHEPADIETMFRSEGKNPRRMPLNTWKKVRKELGIGLGIFLLDGEVWRKQRTPMAKFILNPPKVSEFHKDFNPIAEDLLRSVRRSRDPKTKILADTAPLFYKWSFECVSFYVLGKRLGALDENIPEDCHQFYTSVTDMFTATERLITSLPLHKIWPTRTYKELSKSTQTIYNFSMKYIKEKMEQISEEDKRVLEAAAARGEDEEGGVPKRVDFMTYLVHSGKMSLEEATLNGIDMLIGGVHPIPFTLAWCLYHLANSPKVQDKLRSEVQTVVGSENIVTPTHISKMPYLKNCIKETMRMCPVVPGDSRFLEEDAILSGYKVPAGSLVMVRSLVTSRMPEYFHNPDSFIPERWNGKTHPYSIIPFGFGTRMCLGRRVAELQLRIGLAHVIKNFRVEYPTGNAPVGFVQRIFNYPDKEIDLVFVDLQNI